MKRFIAALAVLSLSFGFLFAVDTYHSEQFYTVKVNNACKDGATCYDMLDKFVKDGVLAFVVKDKNSCTHMTQIMAGIYETSTEAKEAAEALSEAYGVKCVVGESYDISTTNFKDKFTVINTPGGIWLSEAGKYTRLFDYGRGFAGVKESTDNKVSISPSGKEIVFYFKGMIYKHDIVKGKDTILVNSGREGLDLLKSSPQWSYDGKYIAFLDKLAYKASTCLRVVDNTGAEMKFLHDNTNKKEAVLSFKWDPAKNVVYFVEVFDQREVPVGGKLLMADMSGKTKTLVEPEANSDVDRHFRLEGEKLIYSQNKYNKIDKSQYTSEERELMLN